MANKVHFCPLLCQIQKSVKTYVLNIEGITAVLLSIGGSELDISTNVIKIIQLQDCTHVHTPYVPNIEVNDTVLLSTGDL